MNREYPSPSAWRTAGKGDKPRPIEDRGEFERRWEETFSGPTEPQHGDQLPLFEEDR